MKYQSVFTVLVLFVVPVFLIYLNHVLKNLQEAMERLRVSLIDREARLAKLEQQVSEIDWREPTYRGTYDPTQSIGDDSAPC